MSSVIMNTLLKKLKPMLEILSYQKIKNKNKSEKSFKKLNLSYI